MTLLSPWFLLGLFPVVAVALWVMLRPGRQLAVVGSLALWRKAADAMDRSARRRARLVTASWLLLLAGAAAAVIAAARPVYYAANRARRIAVAVWPSAELGPKARQRIVAAAAVLLDRLAPQDRVQLLLPAVLGGATDWLSPAETRRRLASLGPLPVGAGELAMPPADGDASCVYHFAPAGTDIPAGPNVVAIELACDLPEVTIASAGAAPLPDERVQLFVGLRNRTGGAVSRDLTIEILETSEGRAVPAGSEQVVLDSPRARVEKVFELPSAAGVAIRCGGRSAHLTTRAYFVRRQIAVKKVAMLGPDEPLVRRFVKVAPWLELVADPAEADLVIANVEEPPAGIPALLLNPRRSPPAWRRGEMTGPLSLGKADIADDEVLRDVSFLGVAVRSVSPWIAGDTTPQKRLLNYRRDALMLRTQAGLVGVTRRIYVAFDIGVENTNFSMSESFVLFLANATRWLAPAKDEQVRYEYLTPLEAGPQPTWTRVLGPAPPAGAPGVLPWPGIYKDKAGGLHAVSVFGLRAAAPKTPAAEAAAVATLPQARHLAAPRETWPLLLAAAMLLWLSGWAMRLR